MREWWLRAVLVLQAPRAVFVALRDDTAEAASDRAEPVLLILWLAGMAYVLATPPAAHLIDSADYDGLLIAVWTFLVGGLFGTLAYWGFGAILYGGLRALGSQGSYRRSRHLLAFASVPFVLSLALWPVKLVLYGEDLFRSGGSDTGAGGRVFDVLALVFMLWSVTLLVVGVRAVHGWTWSRAVAATAAAAALMVGFTLL